jgi:general secretion pathway protein B
MSYILDALRKVERERRQPHVPGINLERTPEPPSHYRWALILIGLLVLINLVWLAYNALSSDSVISEDSSRAGLTKATELPSLSPLVLDDNIKPTQTPNISVLPRQKQSAKPQQNKPHNPSQSLAALKARVNKNQQVQLQPAPKQQIVQPEPIKIEQAHINFQPVDDALQPILNGAPKRPVIQQPASLAPQAKPKIASDKVIKNAPQKTRQATKPSIPVVRHANVPLLRKMSSEFRDQIPQLDINVYAYAEDSANTFVIINMRKYRTGDRIEGGLKLVSIGRDGVVFNKDGRLFKLPRP